MSLQNQMSASIAVETDKFKKTFIDSQIKNCNNIAPKTQQKLRGIM